MASTNTTTVTDRYIEILFDEDGSSGVDWHAGSTVAGNGLSFGDNDTLLVKSMLFYPSAADDIIIVRDSTGGTSSGALVWKYKAAALVGDHRISFDPPARIRPAIDVSDCAFTGTSMTAMLLIELA